MNRPLRISLCGLIIILLPVCFQMPSAVAQSSHKTGPAGTSSTATAYKNEAPSPLHLTIAEKAWLADHDTITVAFDGYFPPYSYLNEIGQYEGLAVDVFRVLSQRLGITFIPFTKPVWKDLYQATQKQEVDVVATMGRRPEREQWFAFTRPYIFKSLVIMTRKETTDITRPEDLTGRRVALVKSYQYVKDLTAKYPAIKPLYVDTMLDGLNAVAVGRADAAITYLGAGHYLKSRYQLANLKFAAVYDRDRFTESIAVRNDRPELAGILDKALASISDAEMAEINNRWIGPEYLPGMAYRTVFTYFAGILGVIFLLITGFVIWSRSLRKRVHVKTAELRQELEQHKKTEAELRKVSQRRKELEVIINKSPTVFFLWRAAPGWPVEYVSENVRQWGYTPEDFIGGHIAFADIIHSDDLKRVGAEVAGYSESGVAEFRQEYRLTTKTGDIISTEDTTWIRRDQNGRITHYQGIVLDVTERKKTTAEIKRINNELSTINRIIMTCAMTLDFDELLNKIIDEALAITGLEGGTIYFVTSEQTLEIASHPATSQATIEDLATHAIKVGDCLCGQCAQDHKPLILADREAVLKFSTREATRDEDIRFHAAFPLITGKRCLGVLCVFTRTDVKPTEKSLQLLETISAQIAIAVENARLYAESRQHASLLEEKVLERTFDLEKARQALMNLIDDLNTANTKLKELDRLKSMFIASMSHELRTPLNSIIGFSGIILQGMVGEINDEQRDQLERVFRAGKHLLSLITDVIDIAKIESGKIIPYPEEFLLDEVINEACDDVRVQIAEKELELVKNIPGTPIRMKSDRRRLLQCLLNFLSNAVKFSERGTITVEVKRHGDRVTKEQRNKAKGAEAQREKIGFSEDWVEISVTDTGIGIKEDDINLLFESFVRLDSPIKMLTQGTGLGLYLTRKLATEVLGGKVGAESKAGKGSRFWIRMPVVF